jgi:TnpA family transposase
VFALFDLLGMQFSPRIRDLGHQRLYKLKNDHTTIFILHYLEDQAWRQRVHAQLNKGEALHQLRKFLFFVRDGAVSQKDEKDQNNQAACLSIVTNAVIVWNTVYMQAA